MAKLNKHDLPADKRTSAVCGLFCPSCTLFIGTREDPARLEIMAEQFGMPESDLHCTGCRTDQRSFHCRNICTFVDCAADKGVEFCGDCLDYPCGELKAFQQEMPHRKELWRSLEQIRREGFETWFEEMKELYSCPDCRTINSAYDLACRECGRHPSSRYVELYENEIVSFMSRDKD